MERWPEVAPGRGELVEVSPGVLGVGPPLKDAVIDQAAEPTGQDRLRDVEMRLEIVETAHPEERIAEDQKGPALADDLQRTGE